MAKKIKKGDVVWFFSAFKSVPSQLGIIEEISYNGRIATIRPATGVKTDSVFRGISTLKPSSREELNTELALQAIKGKKIPEPSNVHTISAPTATLTIGNCPPISLGATKLYFNQQGGNSC